MKEAIEALEEALEKGEHHRDPHIVSEAFYLRVGIVRALSLLASSTPTCGVRHMSAREPRASDFPTAYDQVPSITTGGTATLPRPDSSIRADALEEAAKVAEDYGGQIIACRIRALKENASG